MSALPGAPRVRNSVAGQPQSGFYAGVWVPELRKKKPWARAMNDLREIAALDSGAGDFGILGGVGTKTADARSRRQRTHDFAPVVDAVRLRLCLPAEAPEVRARHVAALLAFTPAAEQVGGGLRIRFGDASTALWLTRAIGHRGVEVVDVDAAGGVVAVSDPQIVLGRYGFRDGRWVFGQGIDAAVGVGRGAVHAAARFNRQGMKIVCPTAPMMLTLIAVLARLGIEAKPTDGEPRAAIRPGDVPEVLCRLGIGGAAGGMYRRLREAPDRGDQRSSPRSGAVVRGRGVA